jgi:hypothetical protein
MLNNEVTQPVREQKKESQGKDSQEQENITQGTQPVGNLKGEDMAELFKNIHDQLCLLYGNKPPKQNPAALAGQVKDSREPLI